MEQLSNAPRVRKTKPASRIVVVLLLVALSVPIPIGIIRSNWAQLLGRAPDDEAQRVAHEIVDRALADEHGLDFEIRLLEQGRFIYLQIYLIVGPDREDMTVRQTDEVRERIAGAVAEAVATPVVIFS